MNRISCVFRTQFLGSYAFLTLFLLGVKDAASASLPGQLSAKDMGEINRIIVLPASHRSWTAHGVSPEGSIGFEIGLETAFVMRRGLLDFGNGRGVSPRIIPVPRFWASTELPLDIRLSGSAGVGAIFDGIQTYGLGGQWAFYKDSSKGTAFTTDFRYTYTNVFDDLKSHVMGLAVQASKDLVVWQPYAGAGFVVANTTAVEEIMANNVSAGPHTTATYHMFVGARVDLIAKISIQLDVMASRPSLGVLIEKSF